MIAFGYTLILKTLMDAGHEAYFVGGCVRDYCLGRESKDVDITTSATPEEVIRLFPDSKLVGAAFGVVIVKHFGLEVEVATYRTDGAYTDCRRPDQVKFTKDVTEDLARRDFTINALLMDRSGVVYDKVPEGSGMTDLHNGVIRAIGNPHHRFVEDALRMFRAVRFACQLGFEIEPDTEKAIKTHGYFVTNVSTERFTQEFSKILTSGRAAYGVRKLIDTGLMHIVLPEISMLKRVPQNPKYHPEGDVLTHTLGLLEGLVAGCSLTLALAALFHDVGKHETLRYKDGQPTFHGHEDAGAEQTRGILTRLKFPNEVVDRVTSLVKRHMVFRSAKEMRKAKLYRFLRRADFGELLELHRLDALAGSGDLSAYDFCKVKLTEVPPEVLHPVRLVTGADLIAAGLTPGPEFKNILERFETEQLEGRITTRERALQELEEYKLIVKARAEAWNATAKS